MSPIMQIVDRYTFDVKLIVHPFRASLTRYYLSVDKSESNSVSVEGGPALG